jgi:AraC-like DNA-binding protein
MKTHTESFYRYFPISPRDKKWGLFVTTVGESRIAPHSEYPPPGHPEGYAFDWQHGRILNHYTLVYISRGGGRFENNRGQSREIRAGNVMLLFPGVWHRYMPEPETGWHEHWIAFDGKTAREWEANNFISRRRAVWQSNSEAFLLASFSGIMEAVRANRPAIQQIMAGTTSHIIGLLYSAQQSSPSGSLPSQNVIETAIMRLQADLATDVNIQTLARDLGVSYGSFRSTFARHTGMSPHQYLMELRILRARNLLTETGCRVKEIAMQSGFKDEHYFSRLFRARVGVSAVQWRAKSRDQARHVKGGAKPAK